MAAGLAGMGEEECPLWWIEETKVALPPLLDDVTRDPRWSRADQPLVRLLAELETGRTDSGFTTTSVESESIAAATEQP